MKIIIIGAGGQLGSELVNILHEEELIPLTHFDIELTDHSQVNDIISSNQPDIVINTSAYHKVDECEDYPEKAFAVNTIAVRNLARVCEEYHIGLVHFSTDYVFNGEKRTPYTEDDTPDPLSVYATSKLAGEYFVKHLCKKHFIIRTCGLYGTKGISSKGSNFVDLMIRLAMENKTIRVVSDQIVTPTYVGDLASVVSKLIKTTEYGLYHVTNNGECSWYEFARTIFDMTGLKANLVPVSSREYGAKAKRPPYSVLENKNLKDLGMDDLRHWKDALKEYLKQKGYVKT